MDRGQPEHLTPTTKVFKLNGGHTQEFLDAMGFFEPEPQELALAPLITRDLIGTNSRLEPDRKQFYLNRINHSPYGLELTKAVVNDKESFELTVQKNSLKTALDDLKNGGEVTPFQLASLNAINVELRTLAIPTGIAINLLASYVNHQPPSLDKIEEKVAKIKISITRMKELVGDLAPIVDGVVSYVRDRFQALDPQAQATSGESLGEVALQFGWRFDPENNDFILRRDEGFLPISRVIQRNLKDGIGMYEQVADPSAKALLQTLVEPSQQLLPSISALEQASH